MKNTEQGICCVARMRMFSAVRCVLYIAIEQYNQRTPEYDTTDSLIWPDLSGVQLNTPRCTEEAHGVQRCKPTRTVRYIDSN